MVTPDKPAYPRVVSPGSRDLPTFASLVLHFQNVAPYPAPDFKRNLLL